MAKSKKDIDAFQKAMLSNTKIIGKAIDDISDELETPVPEKMIKKIKEPVKEITIEKKETIIEPEIVEKAPEIISKPEPEPQPKKIESFKKEEKYSIEIDKELYQKYKSLTDQYKIDMKKFIEIGLKLFLKLEYHWFGNKS